ncbi:MAG: site-specific integrase, partial [Solirubrobacteraceae bacterium]
MTRSTLDRVRVIGPLAGFADGYRAHLAERGYSLSGARDQLYLLAQVSRWLEAEGLDPEVLASATVLGRCIVWRREQGYRRWLSPMSLRGLVGYLDGLGVLARDDAVSSAVGGLVDAFGCYLLQERGLAALTVQQYEGVARL